MHVYFTEWEDFDISRDGSGLVWTEELQYGDWTGGPYGDGTRTSVMEIKVPEVCNKPPSSSLSYMYMYMYMYVYTCMCMCIERNVSWLCYGCGSIHMYSYW